MTREEMEIWLNYKSGNMAENMLGNMKGGNGNMAKVRIYDQKIIRNSDRYKYGQRCQYR